MTDLDFEELDRAVNSAMGTNQTDEAPVESKTNIDVKKDDDTDINKSVSEERKIQKLESRKPEKSVFKSRQSVRSAGRFMDVVHPSSDMRPDLNSKSANKEAKKQNHAELNENIANTDPNSMPDPLDIHNEIDTKSKPGEKIENLPDSPFLPDAKVEKRPLGAFSDHEKKEPLEKDKEQSTDTENKKSLKDDDKESLIEEPLKDEAPYEPNSETRNVNLPPELQKDILDVESDPTTDKLNVASSRPSKDPVPLGNPYLHNAQTEITQQYKEKQSLQKTSGSIYDTKEYHSPLSHPAKKKSGWMIIIWVILIVAVFIGIAYFVSSYLFAK